ncbi:hypothetical protein BGX29_003478 [Mortierella sp. GBA35]|nr:hypothetical protein BGX23_000108 [Mortierella sp. AD031]KAF9103346.1 hypothetical protein BGX29_003478 [Mortierella sp. GBA35]KAG0211561.1 hypothetical protein BGX33_004204 [Mortierella sp. NVP41]
MTHSPASPTMSMASISSTATVGKKSRRFSIVRLFSISNNSNSNDSSAYQRRSMEPSSMDNINRMKTDIMRERRKSIAALTDNSSFRSMSLDLRPSALRPILGGRKESAPVEMTEKMRQFDEMLQTRKTSTIRISLTPSLLQEP